MAAKDSCDGCPRLPAWSSPTVLIDGERAGTAILNNARIIAEQSTRRSLSMLDNSGGRRSRRAHRPRPCSGASSAHHEPLRDRLVCSARLFSINCDPFD
jgi:hypothetical protein